MTASVSIFLWSRILESSPKLSKNFCCDEALQENVCDETFIKIQTLKIRTYD